MESFPTTAKPSSNPPAEVPFQRLERELARIAKGAGGTVGVSALHFESGQRIALNGSERFPMASTFKVAIAVQLLTRVDHGELTLDQMIDLKPSDFHPGSSTLTDLFSKPGVSLSIRNLLELMLLISDNSATDILLRLAGSPEAVTARLRALAVQEMEVTRPTIQSIAAWVGVILPSESEWTPGFFKKLADAIPPEARKSAAEKWDTDPCNTATPDAMVALLERIHRGEGLNRDSRALMLDIMQRCQTGAARLKGMLPAETVVMHKTGSIGGTTNDVGIMTLPEDAGHVAIAVFVKASDKETPDRERVIAQSARAVYDFFLFQSPPAPSGK